MRLCDTLRTLRNRLIIAGTVGVLGVLQVIIGLILSGDVYSWGICIFSVMTGLAGLACAGYILHHRGKVDAQVAFGVTASILFINIQAVFVLAACTAPLAENFAAAVMDVYLAFVELYSSSCSTCVVEEAEIQQTTLQTNTQDFATETAFVIFSILQLLAVSCGLVSFFNNDAMTDLNLVPPCLMSQLEEVKPITTGEAGFDEL